MYCTNYHDDYTRNKADKLAIVSVDANRKIYRTTADQLPIPKLFSLWKEWSDNDYRNTHLSNRYEHEHTVSLGNYEWTLTTDDVVQGEADRERRHNLYLKVDRKLKEILTKKQYHRFKMRVELDMSEDEIAAVEHVGQPSISECLANAIERIKNHYQEFVNFL